MKELILNDIKTWRERFGLSQKRLSEIAQISLTTLRQLEVGKHKPQKRTTRKLLTTFRTIEANPDDIAIQPRKRGRKKGSTVSSKKIDNAFRTSVEESTSANVKEVVKRSMPIRLTNLDLELINRILNLSGKEKLSLLRKLL